jgi:flagellar motor switch protein FliM
MSSSVLTAEELAALREGAPAGDRKVAEDFDLTSGDRMLRKAVHLIERGLLRFTDAIETTMGQALRVPCDIEPQPHEIVGGSTVSRAISQAGLVAGLVREGGSLLGWIALPTELCFAIVERSFGGRPSALGQIKPPRSRLTKVEKYTVWPHLEQLAAAVGPALAPRGDLAVIAEMPPAGTPEPPEGIDSAISTTVTVTFASNHSFVAILLLPQIAETLSGRGTPTPKPCRGWLSHHLGRASVEVFSVLGLGELTVSGLLALRPGDVLRLDRSQSDLLPLAVENVPKFLGRPIHRNGSFAIEIQTEIP